MAVGQLAGGWP